MRSDLHRAPLDSARIRLWDKAVETKAYDKEQWIELDNRCSALLRELDDMEAERDALKRKIAAVRREAQEEVRDAVRGAQDEVMRQRIRLDDCGNY